MLGRFCKGALLLAAACLALAVAAGPAGSVLVNGADETAAAPAASASAPASAPLTVPSGTVWLAGPAGSAQPLDQALQRARDGDTIELLPGDYVGAWVIEQRRLTLRGMPGSKAPVFKGDGKRGPVQGLLTVRGGEVQLQDLEFRGSRSANGNGAGVRFEGGGVLRVQRCQFFDNEFGIFAASDGNAQLFIDSSAFGMAPKVEGGLHHLLNVGRIARLSVSGTRFQQGFEGHLIKTRARENLIAYNFIHDGQRGGASYEIDIANGGIATVIGNVIGQGADSQNLVMLGYGSEDRAWDVNRLVVAHNTFVNHGWVPAWYLRVFAKNLPANTEVLGLNNLLVGMGVFSLGATGTFEGNHHATRGMVRDLETYALELPPGSSLRGKGVDPRKAAGRDLSPKAEFEWPWGTKPMAKDLPAFSPGAFQK